ncbi:M56 family metallopeptidase [Cohnella yongneupensis]|uniref:M56 family metallopeptidase n=1 Tax=Cohnella yongneupensis TaxID=425006 RepID=A0ABW0QSU8_9BACL
MISLNRVTYLYAFISLGLTFIVLQMILFLLGEWDLYSYGWNLIESCLAPLETNPFLDFACKIGMSLFIAYTLLRIGYYSSKQLFFHMKWRWFFQKNGQQRWQKYMADRYPRYDVTVIEDQAFIALTKGIVKPRIYISTVVLESFGEEEIEAILLHEVHHCKKYDPFHLFVLTVLNYGFGYIPLVRKTAYYFSTWKEIQADRYAVKKMGSWQHLGAVLLQLSKVHTKLSPIGAVGFTDKAINYRLQHLIYPELNIRVPLFQPSLVVKSMIITFSVLFVLLGGCV